MDFQSLGRMPEELFEGGPTPDPAPEYIQDAPEASPQAWEREREARDEIEQEKHGS